MIASESRGAWKEVEARLRPYVARRVTVAAEVDDLLQEIFVRVHRGLVSLRDGESFGGWVYRIASRVLSDAAHARGRDPLGSITEVAEQAITADADVDAWHELEADLSKCVVLFVAHLPSPYREAVTLTELEGLTQQDAADMVGISLSGMKSRIQRGRAKIREMFEANCEISLDCRGRVVECVPRPAEPDAITALGPCNTKPR
jgi:RNA polymerase sigma-70 factor (ECF subfamily)